MRNQRPRASTASLGRRGSQSTSERDEEELRARLRSMSPRSRRIAGIRDDEFSARRPSEQDQDPAQGARRLSTAIHAAVDVV